MDGNFTLKDEFPFEEIMRYLETSAFQIKFHSILF